jgi:hypothetical protein
MSATEGCCVNCMPAVLSLPIMRAACSAEAAMQAAGTRIDCRQGSTGHPQSAQEQRQQGQHRMCFQTHTRMHACMHTRAAGTTKNCRQGSTGHTQSAQDDDNRVNTTCAYRRMRACTHALHTQAEGIRTDCRRAAGTYSTCTVECRKPGERIGCAHRHMHACTSTRLHTCCHDAHSEGYCASSRYGFCPAHSSPRQNIHTLATCTANVCAPL